MYFEIYIISHLWLVLESRSIFYSVRSFCSDVLIIFYKTSTVLKYNLIFFIYQLYRFELPVSIRVNAGIPANVWFLLWFKYNELQRYLTCVFVAFTKNWNYCIGIGSLIRLIWLPEQIARSFMVSFPIEMV